MDLKHVSSCSCKFHTTLMESMADNPHRSRESKLLGGAVEFALFD